MTNPLTQRQKKVLDFMQSYQERHGSAPSHREIARHIGCSGVYGVQKHLAALERHHLISVRPGVFRGTRVVRQPANEIPVYGKVAAGMPIEAGGYVMKTIPIPSGLFRQQPDYLLQVEGDSMVDELIFEGDLVAVKSTEAANPGQIVVAQVLTEEMSKDEMLRCGVNSNGITLKRVSVHRGQVQLKSANRAMNYAPIVLKPERVKIEGIYLGVVRAA